MGSTHVLFEGYQLCQYGMALLSNLFGVRRGSGGACTYQAQIMLFVSEVWVAWSLPVDELRMSSVCGGGVQCPVVLNVVGTVDETRESMFSLRLQSGVVPNCRWWQCCASVRLKGKQGACGACHVAQDLVLCMQGRAPVPALGAFTHMLL